MAVSSGLQGGQEETNSLQAGEGGRVKERWMRQVKDGCYLISCLPMREGICPEMGETDVTDPLQNLWRHCECHDT